MDQKEINQDIAGAVEAMRRGGIIVYPTDTVWGLGCDATNEEAVRRLFDVKRRAEAKSMISLVASEAMLERYVDDIPEVAYQLIKLSDRPVTIVFDHPCGLAPSLLAADGSAGLRVTAERFSNGLCRRLGRPVVSTSANISGEPTPKRFAQISREIIDAADYVALYRRDDDEERTSSMVIKIFSDSTFKILRK